MHLGFKDAQGATVAVLPGDPKRVSRISSRLQDSRTLADVREFRTDLGYLQGVPILVTSTGIGGPSTAIAVEELARRGITRFLRVGTSGSLQSSVKPGDLVATSASVRLDGTSKNYAPIEYPAVADPELLWALREAARQLKKPCHLGITASTDSFYPGQERYGTHSGYVLPHLQGRLAQWRALKVLNLEMESATLLTVASSLGLSAGCLCAVIAQRTEQETFASPEVIAQVESDCIEVALAALSSLLA